MVTILTVLLLVSLSIPVSADQYPQPEIPNELKGYATDNEGNTVEIVGRLVDTVAPRSIDGSYSTVGATLYLTSQIGTSRTWTFTLPDNVYG